MAGTSITTYGYHDHCHQLPPTTSPYPFHGFPYGFPFPFQHPNHLSSAAIKYPLLTAPAGTVTPVVLKSKQCSAFSNTYPNSSFLLCPFPHSGGFWNRCTPFGAKGSADAGDKVRQGSNSPLDQ
jgi:hypothetical protein